MSDIHDVYGVVGEETIRVVAFLKPDHFMDFKSVTMILAIFEQSLLCLFWEKKHDVKFQEFRLAEPLYNTHTAKGPKIKIHHLLHPDDNASREVMERHWQTGDKKANAFGGERVVDRAAIAIAEMFPDDNYCWSANDWFVRVFVLKELMGHSSIQTTSGYAFAGKHQQRNAVELM